ncbi:MAG TPA: hypothetical protein PLN52_01455 [Opitutaceae bacterium]|nr:hypothetical protein [Opitutaceae bacterium]
MDNYLNISEKIEGHRWWRPQAVLKVTGEDALTFLQGQVTQDLKLGSSSAVHYGLWLTPKGRVFADSVFFILGPQDVVMVSERTPAALLCSRMEQYIIADDVYIEDITEKFSGLDIYGVGHARRMSSGEKEVPSPGQWVSFEGGFLFHRWPVVSGIFRAIFAREKERLVSGIPEAELSTTITEWDRIARGIPSVPDDVGPGELPNEAGLEAVAISYTKGCYLGQETMARLKSLGQIRRQLVRIQGTGLIPLTRPLSVFQEGKRVGDLKTTAVAPDGGYLGFALITLLAFDRQKPLQIEGVAGEATLVDG